MPETHASNYYVRRGIYSADWEASEDVRELDLNDSKGGMRFAFPSYGLGAEETKRGQGHDRALKGSELNSD